MKLPPFDSRVPFSKILIFVSFISFSVDSLNECSYGKSEKQLILKIDQHIVTSSKSFASLQSLKIFCLFYLSDPWKWKFFNGIKESFNKERSTNWTETLHHHYYTYKNGPSHRILLRHIFVLIVATLFLFIKHY